MTDATATRLRRPPPPFRTATVRTVTPVGPRLRRVTFAGAELVGLPVPLPAASIRLLLPSPGTTALVIPEWNGNEFLLPDGRRPALRTFTPLDVEPTDGALAVEIVLHGSGAAATWATTVEPGAEVAISGPGRGYAIDPGTCAYLVAGDETAIPAITQLLGALPPSADVQVHVEVASPEGRIDLPEPPGTTVTWHDLTDSTDPGAAMVEAVRDAPVAPDARVWVAGEAASVQRIRRDLFEARGFPRARATVRGYWKRGRAGAED